MRIYYLKNSSEQVVILGADPYSPRSQALVHALWGSPEGCLQFHSKECTEAEVEPPHEDVSVMEDRNGHRPSPAIWFTGDCANSRTGWGGRLPSIWLEEEEPALPNILSAIAEKESKVESSEE